MEKVHRKARKALEMGDVDTVREMIQNNIIDVDESWGGGNCLLDATGYGHVDIVKLLIQGGANINIKGWCGWRPLHIASQEGHFQTSSRGILPSQSAARRWKDKRITK